MIELMVGLLGAIFGSFAGAQVWRIRARQLIEDKASGEEIDQAELMRLKPLVGKLKHDRSQCLSCGHLLAWYDLIPVASWLSTAGKCRYCRSAIGRFEIIMELGLAAFFVASYLVFRPGLDAPLELVQFVAWLAAGTVMSILLAYDAKWFLLPERLNILLAAIALLYAASTFAIIGFSIEGLASLTGSLAIMSGLYLVIFVISKGEWIGFGDVVLGVGLGLLLMRWDQAYLALFLANVIALIVIAPGFIRGSLTRKSHIPFGPFLILASIITVLWGERIATETMNALSGLTSSFFYTLML
jgi:leader peptidase (prepilin peptidase)/N-methyltransferase